MCTLGSNLSSTGMITFSSQKNWQWNCGYGPTSPLAAFQQYIFLYFLCLGKCCTVNAFCMLCIWAFHVLQNTCVKFPLKENNSWKQKRHFVSSKLIARTLNKSCFLCLVWIPLSLTFQIPASLFLHLPLLYLQFISTNMGISQYLMLLKTDLCWKLPQIV